MKPSYGDDAQRDENSEHDALRDQEWRLGLCRRQRCQERQLLERLDDPDEYIQIEGYRGSEHIDPAPVSRQVTGIEREERDRQHDQRYGADDMRRQNVIARKEVPGHTRQNRGREKKPSPTIKAFGAEHTEQDDEAGDDAHQTQDNVNQSKRR